MEDEARLREHRQQGMVARPAVFARVVTLQRAFLAAVALEDRRVQVQTVALCSHRQAFHLPLDQRREQPLHVAHAELPEQIADRVIAWETAHAQQGLQGPVATQPVGVRESPGPDQHRHQKRGEGRCRIDVVRRAPPDRHMLADLADEADLAEISNEDGHPAEGRDGSRRLSQDDALGRVQRFNLGPD